MDSENKIIPYNTQYTDKEDIDALVDLMESGAFLTCGPKVTEFEEKICEYTGAKYGVAVSNGTAALHIACLTLGLKKGDEVIVPAITFAASSNCVLYCGAKPVFCDIEENTLNLENEVAYIGDDLNDLQIINEVKYSACPSDAVLEIKNKVKLILTKKGGEGCVREFCEYILNKKNM